jgi:adenylate kinase family enzyme
MTKRIETYESMVTDVIANYMDILRKINGMVSPAMITEEIYKILGNPVSEAAIAREPTPLPETIKVIICGAPASGKGTQCEQLKEKYGLVHISTGDSLRDHVKRGTDLGKEARRYMESGQLVPDTLVIDIVQERMAMEDCKKFGWLLDGFPRTGFRPPHTSLTPPATDALGSLPMHTMRKILSFPF